MSLLLYYLGMLDRHTKPGCDDGHGRPVLGHRDVPAHLVDHVCEYHVGLAQKGGDWSDGPGQMLFTYRGGRRSTDPMWEPRRLP